MYSAFLILNEKNVTLRQHDERIGRKIYVHELAACQWVVWVRQIGNSCHLFGEALG